LNKFIKESKKEYRKYISTGNEIYLQQAGEKLYPAYKYKLELLSGIEIRGMGTLNQALNKIVKRFPESKAIKDIVFELHVYFYEGAWFGEAITGYKRPENAYVEALKWFSKK
jgi:hypothetical protein